MKYSVAITLLICLYSNIYGQDSLSLNQAITRALEHNYDVRIQALDHRTAEVQNSWGAAGAFPTIDFSLSGTRRDALDDPDASVQDELRSSISARWTIFDGFAVIIRKGRLRQLEQLSAGNTALLFEQTVQSVILAYYQALLLQEEVHVLDTLRLLSGDRYDKALARRELGVSATYDLLQAKTAWLEDEARYLQQFANRKNAIRHLNYLMGVQEDHPFILTGSFECEPHAYTADALTDKMLADNTLLKNRYIQQKLLDKETSLARGDWLPSITLRSGIEGTASGFDRFPDLTKDRSAYGTATLTWNLFSGGSRVRAVQLAKLDQSIGRIETEAMQHRLKNQLLMQLELYEVRKKLLNVADETLATAHLNLQISAEKYKTGAINSFNYRDVQLQYLNAALSRLRAVYQLIETDTDLMRLTGGILSSYIHE